MANANRFDAALSCSYYYIEPIPIFLLIWQTLFAKANRQRKWQMQSAITRGDAHNGKWFLAC